MALPNLMEGVLTRLDTMVETKPPPEELLTDKATRLAKAWDWSVSQLPPQPMERLATILEMTDAEADATSRIAIPASLPQVTPFGINPSSLVPQSRSMVDAHNSKIYAIKRGQYYV